MAEAPEGVAIARVVIIGDDGRGTAAHVVASSGTRVQVLRHLSLADAAADPRTLDAADIVVVDVRGSRDDAIETLLPPIDAAVRRLRERMVVLLETAQIDAVAVGAFGPHVQLLCDPRPVDVLVAVTIASSPAADGARDRSDDADRLQKLNEEVTRIAETLARLTQRDGQPSANGARDVTRSYGAPPPVSSAGRTNLTAAEVRGTIRARRMRDAFFDGPLFADPAWDMLLDLFAAEIEHTRVSVSSLCIAAAVPGTTALRWIGTLSDAGLVERRDDPFDRRRAFISLSAKGTAAMQNYFAAVQAAGLASA